MNRRITNILKINLSLGNIFNMLVVIEDRKDIYIKDNRDKNNNISLENLNPNPLILHSNNLEIDSIPFGIIFSV